MGAITRAFANNILSSGKFDATQLTGTLPALDGSNLTGISAGGGGGMHTLLNTYDATGVSTDLEMDFPVNGGTYTKFRVTIENLYSPSTSKIAFKLKNSSANTYDQLNAGIFQAMGRKHQNGAGGTEYHGITSFDSETANRHNHFDMICSYPNGAFEAYGKHLMWLGGDTTSSQTYSTYLDWSYQNRPAGISGIDKIVLKPDTGASWTAGEIKIYGVS